MKLCFRPLQWLIRRLSNFSAHFRIERRMRYQNTASKHNAKSLAELNSVKCKIQLKMHLLSKQPNKTTNHLNKLSSITINYIEYILNHVQAHHFSAWSRVHHKYTDHFQPFTIDVQQSSVSLLNFQNYFKKTQNTPILPFFHYIDNGQYFMSRFIKPHTSEHTYVEFRFQSSLRKYESKPAKKLKGESACANCTHHHHRKMINSPSNNRSLYFSRGKVGGGLQKTVEKHSPCLHSEMHLVSSNKSIRLSKRKPLEDLSCGRNELQNKIYESLANMERVESKQDYGEVDQEVFLNDFESSMGMDREEEGEGDADFGKIEINQKFDNKSEPKGQHNEEESVRNEVKQQSTKHLGEDINNNHHQQVQVRQNAYKCIKEQVQEHLAEQNELHNLQIQQNIEEESISLRIQNLKVVEEQQAQQNQQQKQAQPQPKPQSQNKLSKERPNATYESPITSQPLLVQQQSQRQQQEKRRPIRCRPQQRIISSKLIEQNQMCESMMQKCLAFEGGRIYIDSQGQNFYISVRVFNKLRRNCAKVDDLISTLIAQRPYLEDKRLQLREEFEEYLRNQA